MLIEHGLFLCCRKLQSLTEVSFFASDTCRYVRAELVDGSFYPCILDILILVVIYPATIFLLVAILVPYLFLNILYNKFRTLKNRGQ